MLLHLCLPGMILPTLPPMLPALSHLANSLHTIGDYYVAGDVDAALNVAREEPLMLPLGAVIGGLALASRGGSLPIGLKWRSSHSSMVLMRKWTRLWVKDTIGGEPHTPRSKGT